MELNLVLFFSGCCFLYFGFRKPNFVIGGVAVSLDRVEVKKLLAATFFHGAVKM